MRVKDPRVCGWSTGGICVGPEEMVMRRARQAEVGHEERPEDVAWDCRWREEHDEEVREYPHPTCREVRHESLLGIV